MPFRHLVVALFLCLFSVVSWSVTRTAPSCSYIDVNITLNASADGDIINVPSGTATWSTNLVITKAIVLQGAGIASTVITMSGRIVIDPGSDKSIRVTGFDFKGGKPIYIAGDTSNKYCLTQIRIDHNSFTGGSDNIVSWGWVESLIDHNFFLNNDRAILVVGDDDYAWARPIAAGTSHAFFIEDNTFKQTNAGGGGLNENVYFQDGVRAVVRYNTFDASEYTLYNACLCDSHANQSYWVPGSMRGQPIVEVYNNVYTYHHSYRIWYIRSGSVLFHDNTFSEVTASVHVQLFEEECNNSTRFPPVRTQWPAQDQIFNSFFWNNFVNGTKPITLSIEGGSAGAVFIQQNRDYFMHAPASSGGYEYFTGARQGGSQTAPTASDTGSMAFSASGANAYYPYTPFQYPHPLQGVLGGNAPNSPTGLRLK
jgi:hypothetical protein